VAGLAVAALAVTLSGAPPVHAALVSPVGPENPDTKFPSFYADSTGLRLQLCLDGVPNCLTSAAELLNAGGDGEGFYYAATADVEDADGPVASGAMELEAAYAGDGAGTEIVFQRTQYTAPAGALVPGAEYTFTDPYWTKTCTANAVGGLVNGPADDCRFETPGTPVERDFEAAVAGPIGPFLTWDTYGTTGAGAPPAGFIGDNATPHTVVGSPTGFNKFRVAGPGIDSTCPDPSGDPLLAVPNCTETDLFTIQGKVQPGASASNGPSAVDFGNLVPGTPVTRTITYTSTGSDSVVVNGVTIDGANKSDFARTENCTTAPTGLATGQSCTIEVRFTPRAGAVSTANVVITDTTLGSPRTIALSGRSLPVMKVGSTSLAFGNQARGSTSPTNNVVVENVGMAPLSATTSISGTGAGQFQVVGNGCVNVSTTCEIGVAFRPASNGAKSATLQITDNSGAVKTVALSGTGTEPPPPVVVPPVVVLPPSTVPPAVVPPVVVPPVVVPPGAVVRTVALAPAVSGARRGNRSVTLSWLSPVSDGGSAVSSYRVQVWRGASLVKTLSAAGAARSLRVTGLVNGVAYRFRVMALNGVGASAPSALSVAVTPATVASAPRAVTAVSGRAGGRVDAMARWRVPLSTGGARVSGYQVFAQRLNARGRVVSTTASGRVAPSARSLVMRLRAGTYRFRVVALNSVGKSALSARSNAVRAR
jgi:hypothetical protein